jgi:hypothetical protein
MDFKSRMILLNVIIFLIQCIRNSLFWQCIITLSKLGVITYAVTLSFLKDLRSEQRAEKSDLKYPGEMYPYKKKNIYLPLLYTGLTGFNNGYNSYFDLGENDGPMEESRGVWYMFSSYDREYYGSLIRGCLGIEVLNNAGFKHDMWSKDEKPGSRLGENWSDEVYECVRGNETYLLNGGQITELGKLCQSRIFIQKKGRFFKRKVYREGSLNEAFNLILSNKKVRIMDAGENAAPIVSLMSDEVQNTGLPIYLSYLSFVLTVYTGRDFNTISTIIIFVIELFNELFMVIYNFIITAVVLAVKVVVFKVFRGNSAFSLINFLANFSDIWSYCDEVNGVKWKGKGSLLSWPNGIATNLRKATKDEINKFVRIENLSRPGVRYFNEKVFKDIFIEQTDPFIKVFVMRSDIKVKTADVAIFFEEMHLDEEYRVIKDAIRVEVIPGEGRILRKAFYLPKDLCDYFIMTHCPDPKEDSKHFKFNLSFNDELEDDLMSYLKEMSLCCLSGLQQVSYVERYTIHYLPSCKYNFEFVVNTPGIYVQKKGVLPLGSIGGDINIISFIRSTLGPNSQRISEGVSRFLVKRYRGENQEQILPDLMKLFKKLRVVRSKAYCNIQWKKITYIISRVLQKKCSVKLNNVTMPRLNREDQQDLSDLLKACDLIDIDDFTLPLNEGTSLALDLVKKDPPSIFMICPVKRAQFLKSCSNEDVKLEIEVSHKRVMLDHQEYLINEEAKKNEAILRDMVNLNNKDSLAYDYRSLIVSSETFKNPSRAVINELATREKDIFKERLDEISKRFLRPQAMQEYSLITDPELKKTMENQRKEQIDRELDVLTNSKGIMEGIWEVSEINKVNEIDLKSPGEIYTEEQVKMMFHFANLLLRNQGGSEASSSCEVNLERPKRDLRVEFREIFKSDMIYKSIPKDLGIINGNVAQPIDKVLAAQRICDFLRSDFKKVLRAYIESEENILKERAREFRIKISQIKSQTQATKTEQKRNNERMKSMKLKMDSEVNFVTLAKKIYSESTLELSEYDSYKEQIRELMLENESKCGKYRALNNLIIKAFQSDLMKKEIKEKTEKSINAAMPIKLTNVDQKDKLAKRKNIPAEMDFVKSRVIKIKIKPIFKICGTYHSILRELRSPMNHEGAESISYYRVLEDLSDQIIDECKPIAIRITNAAYNLSENLNKVDRNMAPCDRVSTKRGKNLKVGREGRRNKNWNINRRKGGADPKKAEFLSRSRNISISKVRSYAQRNIQKVKISEFMTDFSKALSRKKLCSELSSPKSSVLKSEVAIDLFNILKGILDWMSRNESKCPCIYRLGKIESSRFKRKLDLKLQLINWMIENKGSCDSSYSHVIKEM